MSESLLKNFGEPMKAKLTERRFSDPGWIFERKLDGVRAIAIKHGGEVRLISRTGRVLTAYPELLEALVAEPAEEFVADGEIVAFEGDRTSFARLQGRMQIQDPEQARRTGVAVFLYLFDLLCFDGHDLRQLPLRTRKSYLRRALSFRGPVRYTAHRNEQGEKFFREACKKGWEGLIAKRADSPYRHGRSGDWLKFKCLREQELVIGGFTPPKGSRKHFGALLVGYYEDGELLRYAGKVGTGFNERTLADLGRKLEVLRTDHSPFARDGLPREALWVRPELVGQFAFSEWTGDGKLRHPRYLGLRDDKRPGEVVREIPSG
ncbi:MAG: bifunctional non-ous end joining protein LigD [Solirubrobacterales bacterium]|jgi:DNA ligase D-like protein (predicted ligase)|nr:bifunctional non-ous end joining protein LigD [Solirubrobacterales bacterium]